MVLKRTADQSKTQTKVDLHEKLKNLNGSHPFRTYFPDGYVNYSARQRRPAKVVFFNFDLAEEMGLVSPSHSRTLDKSLESALLDTFALQIINEYDLKNNIKIDPRDRKPGFYMATRYLQLQHPSRIGLTSGDGRAVWNGTIHNKGKIWDIMSTGAGATSLSPATAQNGIYYKTGDPNVSYGCGYASVDDGLAAALMSETFHRQGIATERVLAVIEFKNGISINVRAHQNLLRPSHIFRLLKQKNHSGLKMAFDYHLTREKKNKRLDSSTQIADLADVFCRDFAKAAARFEHDYIFVWMDWDGDNILMDGGIIDYGSVRRFGTLHKEYRYDDDDRWSTTLHEQKIKAKETVAALLQALDFSQTGILKPLKSFKSPKLFKVFNQAFEAEKLNLLRRDLALESPTTPSANIFLKELRSELNYWESLQTKRNIYRTADGVSSDALFNMKSLMNYLKKCNIQDLEKLTFETFFKLFKTQNSRRSDLVSLSALNKRFKKLKQLMIQTHQGFSRKISLQPSPRKACELMTGDASLHASLFLTKYRKKLSAEQLSYVIHCFSHGIEAKAMSAGPIKRALTHLEKLAFDHFETI